MIEDNGKTDFEEHTAETEFENTYDELSDTVTLKISVKGDLSVIPNNRRYKIVFKDIDSAPVEHDFSEDEIVIKLENPKPLEKESYRDRIITAMSRWNETTEKKSKAYKVFEKLEDKNALWRALHKSNIPKPVFDRIAEILSQ